MSKIKLFLAILVLGLVVWPVSTLAYEVRHDESVYIPKEQSIDGNLYAAASNLIIDGNVYGDLICAAKSLTVNGNIDGDVLCAASDITINGEVSGSIRTAGENLKFNQLVKRNIMALGSNIILGGDAKVGGDVLLAAATMESHGQINGSLHGLSDSWLIDGPVLKNVDARINQAEGKFILSEKARIGGSLKYMSPTEVKIDNQVVAGEIVRLMPQAEQFKIGAYLLSHLFALLSALLVALLFMSLWPKTIRKIAVIEPKKIGRQVFIGLATLLLTPIVCLILLFTFIGWPLALIMMVVWLILIYLAKILLGVTLGFWGAKYLKIAPTKSGLVEMLIGVTALWIICAIPWAGWLFSLVAIVWGLGIIGQEIKTNR